MVGHDEELAVSTATPDAEPVELMKDEIGRADGAMLRTDTKAGLLLAVFSPITAVGLAVLTRVSLHPVVTVIAAVAAVLSGSAVLLLLWTIRPKLDGSGLITYHTMSDRQLKEHFAALARDHERWHCERLIVVSGLAVLKFRLVRLASTLIALAVVSLAVAAILGLVLKP